MRREDTSNVGSLDPGPCSFWVKLEWAGFGPEVGAMCLVRMGVMDQRS